MGMDPETWKEIRNYKPEQLAQARQVLAEIRQGREVWQAMRRYPQPDGGYMSKHLLVAAYHQLVAAGEIAEEPGLLAQIRMKPVRTLSGVTTVTVLTKPYPCPGKCIFCPTDARMPKSYLPDEPGARRGLQNDFDPFAQTASRLQALEAVGHPTDKIELLILGGTWSAYRRDYQEWFIQRCFDALNGFDSATLDEAHLANEETAHRNVGLVIETRPDEITWKEMAWLRRLGVTKVQMGAQSLDDRILALNQRGHTSAETVQAVSLLRAGGFKVVLHWMPNLLGATPQSDEVDFGRLWQGACPDEIKIYPCQLLANAELYEYWQRGEYQPYTQAELIELIANVKPSIPPYCRVNRIIRDIPSDNVVAGNRRTSLRQDVQAELERRGQHCGCIRCHEVRGDVVEISKLQLEDYTYPAGSGEEHFLNFRTPAGQIAAYLRLSLPRAEAGDQLAPPAEMADLAGSAVVREVHVYGQSLSIGAGQEGAAQHSGLGTSLLEHASQIARQAGYSRLAVIAAIGTRGYYLRRGFERGELYLVKPLE